MNTLNPLRNRRVFHVVAMGLLATAAAVVQVPAQADPGNGHRQGPGRGPGMAGGPMSMMGGGMLHERALDAVNATDEQRTQIRQIAEAARADLRALHDQARPLHDQARELFVQPTVDARAAEALRLQFLAQHDQASKRMMQAMLDASRVLTPEQRARLAELQAQRRAKMEQRRGAGR